MSVTIQIKRGTEAQIQAATLAIGEMAFATDTKSVLTYDGVAKQLVGRALYNTLANRPAYGVAGRLFVDSATGVLYVDTGAAWVSLGPYASLESDMVPTDELGTGTADSGSFLRGDRTWQPVSVGYPSTWYWADQSFLAKTVSVAADRYKLLTPNAMQIDIGGSSYTLSAQATLDLSQEATWDTTSGTNYTTAANRIGKDFYIYACHNTVTSPLLRVSANATYPTGTNPNTGLAYSESNTRKVGGFHCLCVAVGTISGHSLTGYLAGDILPLSVWDLKFRATPCGNEGMVYDTKDDEWKDIYPASGSGATTASVYYTSTAATVNRNWMDFVDDGLAVGKHLLRDAGFQSGAAGSNEETQISTGAFPAGTGGYSDTAGRRMISNIGMESCCGHVWQWLDEQSTRWDFTTAWGWYDLPGAKGSLYNGAGAAGTGDVKLIAGGNWDSESLCGSRSRRADSSRWGAGSNVGGRFSARTLRR